MFHTEHVVELVAKLLVQVDSQNDISTPVHVSDKYVALLVSQHPPLWGDGVTQQSFIWRGGSAPRSPPLNLLYTALEGKVRPSGRSLPTCTVIGITLRVSVLPLVPETFYARFPVSAFCRRFVGLQLTPSALHALKIS